MRWFIPMVFGLSGCEPAEQQLGGYALGEPAAAIFGHNPQSRLMVVLSDLPDICGDVQQTDPPGTQDFWVISAWTTSSAEVSGDYPVSGFSAVYRAGAAEEFQSSGGTLSVDNIDDDGLSGQVELSFDSTGDTVRMRVGATPCDAHLFVGMEVD